LNLRESDIGRPVGDLTTGLDIQLVSDAQQVIQTRVAAERDIHTVQNRCYLRRIELYRSGTERIGGVVVSFVDITGQMRADAQLRRFAMLLRDSDDAIMATDFDGRIRNWNRGAERLYGYTESEALKLNMRHLLPHDVLHSTLGVMRRVAAGEIVPSFDTRRRTRDGRKLDVSATVSLLLDAAGKPESLVMTERDITARRQAEEESRRLNSLLEQRVAERTTELQHSEEQIRRSTGLRSGFSGTRPLRS
jgi:two-component system CheB/CheR fusion protein